jgi:hypothetical protein
LFPFAEHSLFSKGFTLLWLASLTVTATTISRFELPRIQLSFSKCFLCHGSSRQSPHFRVFFPASVCFFHRDELYRMEDHDPPGLLPP